MRPHGSRPVGGRPDLLYHADDSPDPEEATLKANLVAVQAKTGLKDYATANAFHAKMASLMERTMRQVDRDRTADAAAGAGNDGDLAGQGSRFVSHGSSG